MDPTLHLDTAAGTLLYPILISGCVFRIRATIMYNSFIRQPNLNLHALYPIS